MKWWSWVGLAVAAFLISRGNLALAAVLYLPAVAVLYVVSLWRHPHRKCRKCKGTGRQAGTMFTWGDRPCTTCGGGPRHRRWGTQFLYGGNQVWAEKTAVKARRRKARPLG
jgi:hypothetical protein